MIPDPEIDYLRKREAEEIAAASAAHCMVRTAHQDLAEGYAEKADALEQALADDLSGYEALLSRLDQPVSP